MAYDMTNDEILEALPRVTPQWLAGFFDGEGWVTAYKTERSYRLAVGIGQADAKVIAMIFLKFPNGEMSDNVQKNRRQHRIRWHGKSAIPMLNFIKDHVICKRRQIEAGIQLANLTWDKADGTNRISEKDIEKRKELALIIQNSNHGINTLVEVLP